MKARILLAVTLLFLLASCAGIPAVAAPTVRAQSADAPRSITVNGEATVLVAPDQVVVNVGVMSLDPTLANAKRANDQAVTKALQIARRHGIPVEKIQTDYVNIQPVYDNAYSNPKLTHYQVRKSISLTLTDLNQFEPLLTELLEAGVNNVNSIQFQTTELRKHRDKARALALQAAQEKADAMAGELGQSAGQPLTITEQYAGSYSYYSWWGGGYNAMTQNVIQNSGPGQSFEGEGTIAPGQIEVTARVTVQFGLE